MNTVRSDIDPWILALRAGNERAMSHFYELHYRSLCYFANRFVQETDVAEDLVAECFCKLWERRDTFETSQNIKAFLYISCRNACLNHLKHIQRRNAAQELYFQQLNEGEDTILLQIIETEVLNIIAAEIEELPDKCREVFKLLYVDGEKTDAVAARLGISVKTVRGHKARAIALLKTALLKKGVSVATVLAFLLWIQ